jgi:hypothetical protein
MIRSVYLLPFLFLFKGMHPILAQFVPPRDDMKHSFALYAVCPAFATAPGAAINDLLLANDYPRLPKGHFNWGIGAHYRWKRLLLGAELMASYQTRRLPEMQSQFMRSATTTNIFAGVQVYKTPWFAITPYAALSFTQASVFLSKQTGTASAPDLLAAPGNTVQLTHLSSGILLGVGMDLHHLWRKNSALMSLRMGYRVNPGDASLWESRFTTLTNAPADRFNYFFVQFNMGTIWNRD